MKDYLIGLFQKLSEKLPYIFLDKLIFTVPKDPKHGDLSTNYAMIIAREVKKSPVVIAKEIIENLSDEKNYLSGVDIAGAGFINFKFSDKYVQSSLSDILSAQNDFGKSGKYNNKKAQVEFVSANPTGPLTVGHGRNAIIGDTIANLLSWVGYSVEREYYFNNAGRQMRVLGESVRLRYLQLCGRIIEFPEDYYQGEYITDIADKIFNKYGNSLIDSEESDIFRTTAESEIFLDIKNTLKSLDIIFDSYFNENTLYSDKKLDLVLQKFEEAGLLYEKDNAKWLALSKLGYENDKVVVKSSGEPTYRLPDIAYHLDKFKRNYDLMVDIFGSDHIATYPDVLAGLKILGYDTEKVKVIIHQFVTVIKDGEIVKMSTRKANFITLDWLIDEVGKDVVRYFFLMRDPSSHLNFDMDLARKSSDENPVFYLQYAHARISGILRMAAGENLKPSPDFNLLNHPLELSLIKHLNHFPDIVESAADSFDILILINYLHQLAEKFHRFYHDLRVIGVEKELSGARLSLCNASGIVLGNGLKILGINAPEKM